MRRRQERSVPLIFMCKNPGRDLVSRSTKEAERLLRETLTGDASVAHGGCRLHALDARHHLREHARMVK